MKPRSLFTLIVGMILVIFGVIAIITNGVLSGIIPLGIGGSLCYLGWSGNRIALLIFGHTCIILGCFMITWGIYLLPYSKPILSNVFTRPLFWGLFSVMGGICANYHGFCQCIRRQK